MGGVGGTKYRQTAVLALDAEGRVTRVEDTLRPAEPAEEYHFAYRQLAGAHQVVAPMTVASFSDGCPPARDAAPVLVALTDAIDRLGTGADMVRRGQLRRRAVARAGDAVRRLADVGRPAPALPRRPGRRARGEPR